MILMIALLYKTTELTIYNKIYLIHIKEIRLHLIIIIIKYSIILINNNKEDHFQSKSNLILQIYKISFQ